MTITIRTDVKIGDVVPVEMPYSEACMYMRLAGRVRLVQVREHGAQILNDDGTRYSFPVTHGEAGIRTQTEQWTTDVVRCHTIDCKTPAAVRVDYPGEDDMPGEWVCERHARYFVTYSGTAVTEGLRVVVATTWPSDVLAIA